MITIIAPNPNEPISVTGEHTGEEWIVMNTGTAEKPHYFAYTKQYGEGGYRCETHYSKWQYSEKWKMQELGADMEYHGNWEAFLNRLQSDTDKGLAERLASGVGRLGAHAGPNPPVLVDGTQDYPVVTAQRAEPTEAEKAYMRKHNLDKSDLGYDDSWE